MGALSHLQFESLRMLVESAPDATLRNLDMALASDSSGSAAMAEIRRLIAVESGDRVARDRVLGPLLPLCRARPRELQRLVLPPAAPRRLWRALISDAPHLVALASEAEPDEDDPFPACDDDLCRVAAEGLRAGSGAFADVARMADGAAPGGAGQLAACLSLAPIARRAAPRLADWIGRLTEERAAAARLAYKDAVAVGEDCGPRLLEMLMARLDEPWLVLRLVSAVMDRPTDAFVAASELASFGERLLDDIDRRLQVVTGFALDEGRAAGAAAGQAVHAATMEIATFEESLELSRQGPWGLRLMAQKRLLASGVENKLKHADDAVAAALPLQRGPKRAGPRGHPRLSHDPDRGLLTKAEALCAFVPEVRSAAAVAGFGAVRAQAAEAIEARIAQYVEDLIETIHAQAPEAGRARLYLDAAAELLGLLTGAKAAQIVRRRAAAA